MWKNWLKYNLLLCLVISSSKEASCPSNHSKSNAAAVCNKWNRKYNVIISINHLFLVLFITSWRRKKRRRQWLKRNSTITLQTHSPHRITGNRLCMYSTRRYPRLYLFSSSQTCPSWPIPERVLEYLHRRKQRAVNLQIESASSQKEESGEDGKLQCCFGDGPGRYMHPTLQKPYCSIACYKRLEEERLKSEFVIELNEEDLKSIQKPEKSVAVKREMATNQRMGMNYPATSPFSSSPPVTNNYPSSLSSSSPVPTPTSPYTASSKQPATVANRSHSYSNHNTSNGLNGSNKTATTNGSAGVGLAKSNSPSSTSSTVPPSNSLLMPSIITTTTPNGQIVRYQLHHDKSVLISSKSITITIQPNQIYYLQSEMNGRVIATPHLLGGTVMRNNVLHYCMIPMVVIPSTVSAIPAKPADSPSSQESGPK